MKSFLKLLDKSIDDGLSERIDKEKSSSSYWMFFGVSILSLLIASILNIVTSFGKNETPPAPLYSVVKKNGNLDPNSVKLVRITLPSAHNTLKNVTSWIKESIGETYTFSFLTYDKQVQNAAKYFTPEGYDGYLKALQNIKMQETVVGKKLEIATIPLKEPILINSGNALDVEFWRFKTPVAVNYFGGKDMVREKYMLELLIKKVPSYVNPKSLAIHEYILTPM